MDFLHQGVSWLSQPGGSISMMIWLARIDPPLHCLSSSNQRQFARLQQPGTAQFSTPGQLVGWLATGCTCIVRVELSTVITRCRKPGTVSGWAGSAGGESYACVRMTVPGRDGATKSERRMPGRMPRRCTLLLNAEPGPPVLVRHSFGGLFVRMFAEMYQKKSPAWCWSKAPAERLESVGLRM
jgi:hypothetical protein